MGRNQFDVWRVTLLLLYSEYAPAIHIPQADFRIEMESKVNFQHFVHVYCPQSSILNPQSMLRSWIIIIIIITMTIDKHFEEIQWSPNRPPTTHVIVTFIRIIWLICIASNHHRKRNKNLIRNINHHWQYKNHCQKYFDRKIHNIVFFCVYKARITGLRRWIEGEAEREGGGGVWKSEKVPVEKNYCCQVWSAYSWNEIATLWWEFKILLFECVFIRNDITISMTYWAMAANHIL